MRPLPYLCTAVCLLLTTAVTTAQEVGLYRVPRSARDILVEMKATVGHGNALRDYTARLTPEQVDVLRQYGFRPLEIHADPADELRYQFSQGAGGYTSYGQMRADFYAYAAAFPSIARIEVLGLSVQGREIFGLAISGNVGVEEDEPEVVFWGSIHGDEFASGEVPYLYALYLCDNYGVDPTITQYVDQNEIWCIPLLNPDGHELGTRNNANGVDLNRDWGFQWDGWGGSSAPHSQVETRAVRQFCMDNNITLASTMHCSGNVFLYPWGFEPDDASDVSIIQQVGSTYAALASYNLLSSWVSYETHGELLDYVYGSHGALCYTAEISNVFNQLPQTYSRNESGMSAFLGLTGGGLHGLVTDAQTGAPLWASVWISGNDVPAYTDPVLGDLHRLVSPGTYDVTVWANGYAPQTVSGVVVPALSQPPGEFQVALVPDGGEYAFFVTAVNQDDAENSYANTTPPSNALGAPDGAVCALGDTGFILLDMGPGHAIADGPGDDFTVTEALFAADPLPEKYAVFAGDAYVQDVLVGQATGTASFDLGAVGVASTRYLKIVDRSNANPVQPLAGMDLDAVTILNQAGGPTVLNGGTTKTRVPSGGIGIWDL